MIMVETIAPPEQGTLNLTFNVRANIQITAQKAQQLVNTFVRRNITELLQAEPPDLVLRTEGTYWRVPLTLSSAVPKQIGLVGVIDVEVEHGTLNVTEHEILALKTFIQQYQAEFVLDNDLAKQQLDEMTHLKRLAQQVAQAWTSPQTGGEILTEMREAL